MPEIRDAREEDLIRLAQIGREGGLDITEAVIRESFRDEARELLICENQKGIVGYADILLTGYEAEIVDIAVSEQARSRGIGEALIRTVQQKLQKLGGCDSQARIFLEVAENNRPARRLYEKTGFESVGRRKNYYPDYQDAIVMSWTETPGCAD